MTQFDFPIMEEFRPTLYASEQSYRTQWSLFWGQDKEEEYQRFLREENNIFFLASGCIFVTIVNIYLAISTNDGDYSEHYRAFAFSRLLILPPIYMYCYAFAAHRYSWLKKFPIPVITMGDFALVAVNAVFGSFMVGMALHENNSCERNRGFYEICGDVPALLIVNSLLVLFGSLSVLRCRRMISVVLAFTVQISSVIATMTLNASNQHYDSERQSQSKDILLIINIIVLEIVVIYGMEKYSRQMFMLLLDNQISLRDKFRADNEKNMSHMRSESLKHLIGNVAHDLKTPLQAFSYELDCISSNHLSGADGTENSRSKDDLSESILLLKSICAFMTMTINRAIDYTKATAGLVLKPSMETVSVNEVLDWVVNCMSRSGVNPYVSFEVESFRNDECEFMITDKQWLMENLLCLTSNARKFTTKGSILIRCSVVKANEAIKSGHIDIGQDTLRTQSVHSEDFSTGMSTDEELGLVSTAQSSPASSPILAQMECPTYDREMDREMVLVEVIDEGIGIPDAEKKALFQPFKQAQKRAGGTGLGLFSLSKRIESLGGSCGVTDRPDNQSGSRFWFTFPYRPDTSMQSTNPSHDVSPSKKSPNHHTKMLSQNLARAEEASKKTILLVDDSELIQKTSIRAFHNAGYDIEVANNGLDCLEKVERGAYRLVLMDMHMPVMDGLEAAKRLRMRELANADRLGGDRLVIVGVSANSDNETRQEALDAGMDGFMPKPLDIGKLRSVLRALQSEHLLKVDDEDTSIEFNI